MLLRGELSRQATSHTLAVYLRGHTAETHRNVIGQALADHPDLAKYAATLPSAHPLNRFGNGGGIESAPTPPAPSSPPDSSKTKAEVPHPDSLVVNNIDRNASPQEKLNHLAKLTEQNKPIADEFLKGLDEKFGTKSGSNAKLPDRILEKAKRPSTLATKPWHDVEHVRDSFRFKTELNDITQLPAIIDHLKSNLGATIIKKDVNKFLTPGEWGWRITAFDLKMPNGQLVEYYLPVKELEAAKKSNHKIFEKWRNQDVTKLTPDQLREMEGDLKKSRAVYGDASKAYIARTGQDETSIRAALDKVTASSSPTAENSSEVT